MLPGDISAAARALLAVAPEARGGVCRRIFSGAVEALVHEKLYGRPHPRWGDGSLSAAARRWQLADEPFWDDPAYLRCLQMVLRGVAAFADEAEGGAPAG